MSENLWCEMCGEDFDYGQFGFEDLDYSEQLVVAKDDGWSIAFFNTCPDCQENESGED